ncbi:uncharacterized protein RCC_07296 [Ramularia collo-cygni]|uniref:SCP domain-containing protein n=1 Tax=Ramularia collo-cygni TaxID=112498 RepID=A0A2D3VKA9_9PEZI|nr:uncharacterized protein RCC_07296 [Ramularia collo-cygni]CZT21433.1 uncharacterized protein RCC_07296 [Ramularia collo-cygni]
MNRDQQLALRRHSTFRTQLGLQPLIWSWQLAEHAQDRADALAESMEKGTQFEETALEGESVAVLGSVGIKYPLDEASRLWQINQVRGEDGQENGVLEVSSTWVRFFEVDCYEYLAS